MDFVFVKDIISRRWNVIPIPTTEVDAVRLKSTIIDTLGFEGGMADDLYLCCNGRKVECFDSIRSGECVTVLHRLLGGKGGFGSMLRAIGAQIEKTTNREACRDLSGRRLRDINEEMRLKKWIAKQVEREQEKEMKRLEKLERKLATPKHEFKDPTYEKDRSSIPDKVNDALSQGLALEKSLKRSVPELGGIQKKARLWHDVEDDLKDDDEEQPTSSTSTCISSSVNTDLQLCQEDAFSGHKSDNTEKQVVTMPATNKCKNTLEDDKIQKKETNQPLTGDLGTVTSSLSNEVVEGAIDSTIKEDDSLNLNEFNSAEELASLGLNRLKAALSQLGLKCGGTLKERAERLFSVKGLSKDEIDPSLFAKKK